VNRESRAWFGKKETPHARNYLRYVGNRTATPAQDLRFSAMEHKGIEYTVVQTANPTGWRWTVELAPPQKSRTGVTQHRATAVAKVIATIDSLASAASEDSRHA